MNTIEMGRQSNPRVLARFLVGSETVIGIIVESRLHEVEGVWADLLGAWADGKPDIDLTGRSWDLGSAPTVQLRLSVDGEESQDSNTGDMIHSFPELIETISSYVELQVGDIIATGSPAGVGFIRVPPKFLAPGDVLMTEIVDYMSAENAVL